MKINMNPAFANNNFMKSVLNVNNTNKAISKPIKSTAAQSEQKSKSDSGLNRGFKQDNNMLDALTAKKESVLARKRELITKTLSGGGKSLNEIRGQLDFFDEQVKNIESQMSQLVTQQAQMVVEQQKAAIEAASEREKQNGEMTEAEISAEKMSNIVENSHSLDVSQSQLNISEKVEGRMREVAANKHMDSTVSLESTEKEFAVTTKAAAVSAVQAAVETNETLEETTEDITKVYEEITTEEAMGAETAENKEETADTEKAESAEGAESVGSNEVHIARPGKEISTTRPEEEQKEDK